MSHRTTITLDDVAFKHLNSVAKDNRSAYINKLLKQDFEDSLETALIQANEEEANDPDYQEQLKDWDDTISDGLNYE